MTFSRFGSAIEEYSIIVILLFFFTKAAIFIESYRFAKLNGCKSPAKYPQAERIIGYENFRELLAVWRTKRLLPTLLTWTRETGNTFSLVNLGRKIIVTTEPENIKSILATKFNDFGLGQRAKAMGALLGPGIFTSDGLHWQRSRALIRPIFTKSRVADLNTFESNIQRMITKIPRDGSIVDLQPLFFQLTLDNATEFLFGESINALCSPEGSEQQLFSQDFDFAQRELNFRLGLGSYVWLYHNKEFTRACVRIHQFVDKFVVKALAFRQVHQSNRKTNAAWEKEKHIFMNQIALETDDPLLIRSELLHILLAGRDTTAGLLSNTFHVLARRQDIWAKLKTEVDQLDGRKPDYETVRGMKYLRHVVNESLRIYPPVPNNMRVAKRNTTLPVGGGHDGKSPIFIRRGSMVLYSVYSMHRRKDFYGEDADEYKPERWEDLRVGWGYLPFNGGPRICVGQQFALIQVGYTIVRLIQEFERIESRDQTEWVENLHLTLSSGNGVQVALFPRS